jgi:hypothetical protein
VYLECLEQFGTEHDIAISETLAALDVNHPALTVDVFGFQVGQLGVPGAGGVEGHEQDALTRSARRMDELRDFFPAKDHRQTTRPFPIGSLLKASSSPECLDVEKA